MAPPLFLLFRYEIIRHQYRLSRRKLGVPADAMRHKQHQPPLFLAVFAVMSPRV